MTQTLHPYQVDMVRQVANDFRAHQTIVAVLPTGGGKTILAGHITSELMRQYGSEAGCVALFLVHKHELIWQALETLERFGLGPHIGIVAANHPVSPWAPLQIAMLPTLVRRLDRVEWLQPRMIFVDECHHARAQTWERVLSHWSRSYRLGLTATPERLDGKGLRPFFGHMVEGPQISELQPRYLAPVIVAAPPTAIQHVRKKKENEGPTLADRMTNFDKFCTQRRTIVFESSIASSQDFAFKLRNLGHSAEHVDGKMPMEKRRQIISRFNSGETSCLVNVDIVSEGFDCPDCEVVMHAAYTKSMTRYRQRNGRVMRVKQDGGAGVIVDLAGLIWEHGYPDGDMHWSLDDGHVTERAEGEAPDRRWRSCSECSFVYARSVAACPQCGTAPPARLPSEIDVELDITRRNAAGELTRPTRRELSRRIYATGGDLDALTDLAKEYGYSPAWPRAQLAIYFPQLIPGTPEYGKRNASH